MKKKAYVLIALLTAMLYSCSEKEDLQTEKISFSIQVASSGIDGGRTAALNLPVGASLLISLTDDQGNAVLTRHRINLLQLGNSYITDPLVLAPGRYALTDFMVVNDSSEILFATPLKNSKLSKVVSHPLPYKFVVSRNNVANVEMEVVDATLNQPQDFGYVAFDINVVNPLSISVFRKAGDKVVLTEAKAYIYDESGNGNIQTFDLNATINLLSFNGNPSSTYTLIIEKVGHVNFYKEFTYSSLIAELGDNPLKVILEPTPVPAIKYWGEAETVILEFNASGDVYVDYGNGESESRELNYVVDGEPSATNWIALSDNALPLIESNPVQITGDLDVITAFWIHRGYNVDLSALNSLNKVVVEECAMETLDLTSNTTINSLFLSDNSINNLILPSQHNINDLFLGYDDSYRDMVIANVYNNAVAKNITGGNVYIYYSTEPLSEEAQNQLDDLINTYQWTVSYQ